MEETKGIDRRKFVRSCAMCAAGLVVASATGCSLFEDPEVLVCTRQELEEAKRIITKFNGKKVLTTKLNGKLTTFSLICRHKRCTIGYVEELEQFVCPCHDGIYDAQGNVVSGPPKKPLIRFITELRGEEVWVLNKRVKE